MRDKKEKIIVVLGPTASGKSDLAVSLAKKFNGEIISADSRQVYRGLDIGTGKVPRDRNQELRIKKPSFAEASAGKQEYTYKWVPHYLLDVANPRHQFSVAEYQELGRKAIADILSRGKLPIVCGGTGFYIDALIYDYTLPSVEPDAKLRTKLEKLSTDALFEKLQKLDPRRAKGIDSHNRRRLVRALEVTLSTGKPNPTAMQAQQKKSKYDVLKIGLSFSNEVLRARIEKRLLARIAQGMVREVKKLRAAGLSWKRMEELGLEYRYLSRYVRGLISKGEMIQKLNTEIWHYAKRQMTWFKRDKSIRWISNPQEAKRIARAFLK